MIHTKFTSFVENSNFYSSKPATFPVIQITKEIIAKDINQTLDGWGFKAITGDELSDEFCSKYSDLLGELLHDAYTSKSTNIEHVKETMISFIKKSNVAPYED
jgi:hypothetical protein